MRTWMRQALQIAAGAAALAAAIAWLSGGCGERIEPGEVTAAPQPLPEGATTARVEAVREPVVERASGTIASARQTTVSSKILARIERIHVTAGSVVERGTPLVELDSRDLEARLGEAREALRAARARLELTRREQQRAEELLAAGVGTQQRLDEARSAFQVAQADVQAADERLADARVAVSHAEIRSPAAGRVVDRLAEPGDTAAPGAPLLRIYDPGALRLEVPVREALAVTLSPGQSLRVAIEALGTSVAGSIDEIVPFAEPGARTLLVKVRLPEDPRLFAGMFGRVEIPAGSEPRLLIPREAVERVGQLEFAEAVGPNGGVERRVITTGAESRDGRIEVLSGLAEGERVVVRGGR